MSTQIHLRPATENDIPAMVAIFNGAFKDNVVIRRCFPTANSSLDQQRADGIRQNMADSESHMIIVTASTSTVASDSQDAPIVGWARWVRKPLPDQGTKPEPPPVFTEDMYPADGDPKFAVRFFQVNHDAMTRIIRNEPMWFLSTMAVAKDYQRRGVGGELLRYGVNRADQEGWTGYLNATVEGKALYEKFGFETAETSELGDGIVWYHMRKGAEA